MAADDPINLNVRDEWAGLWWLPSDPECRVPGVLRYSPQGGLALSLIGAFEDRIMSSPHPGVTVYHEGTRTWDVIHGVAEGREITLFGGVPTSSNRTLFARVKSPDKQTIEATAAVVGAHVDDEDDPAFCGVEVSVEDMTRWAATSVFQRSIGFADDKADGTGNIAVKPVEGQAVTVSGTEYRLVHTHTLPFFDHLKGETVGRMRDKVSMLVTPEEPIGLRSALDAARLVQDLISLATHRAAGVIWLRLQVVNTESTLPDGHPVPRRRAHVLYSPTVVGKHDAMAVEHDRALFTCASLPFEVVMPRWREAHDRLRAATNMILGLRYAPARFVENNLLTAVGAAEVLHRGLGIDEKPIPKQEFAEMREAMLAQVPEQHRDRFKGAIRNDPTLRDRLRALAQRPDQEAISKLVTDVEHWAKRTTRARNDLAHEGATPNHTLEELAAIVDVTTAVVTLNLLQELGLSSERQRAICQEHPSFRSAANAARQFLAVTGN